MINSNQLDTIILHKLADDIFTWLMERNLVDSPQDAQQLAQELAYDLKLSGWSFHPWIAGISDRSHAEV